MVAAFQRGGLLLLGETGRRGSVFSLHSRPPDPTGNFEPKGLKELGLTPTGHLLDTKSPPGISTEAPWDENYYHPL